MGSCSGMLLLTFLRILSRSTLFFDKLFFPNFWKYHLFSHKIWHIWYFRQVGDQVHVTQHPEIDVWYWIFSLGAERSLQPIFGLLWVFWCYLTEVLKTRFFSFHCFVYHIRAVVHWECRIDHCTWCSHHTLWWQLKICAANALALVASSCLCPNTCLLTSQTSRKH